MARDLETLIEVKNLSLSLEGRVILDSVNLVVHRGEIVTLIGPNGAGKSCLIKCLLQLLPTYLGVITRKKPLKIGYAPQKIHFEANLPLKVSRFLSLGHQSKTIAAVMAEVGITELANHWMHKLSGGELQRVLLARALVQEPDLLVLDEPAQGVDLLGQGEVYRLLAKIRSERNCGILLVSHDLNLVMAETDTVICLNKHVCCSGHPQAVAMDPAFIKLFGSHAAGLALYKHEHDHQHGLEGEVQCIQEHNND